MGRATVAGFMIAAVLTLAGCSSSADKTAAPLSTPEIQKAAASGKKSVIFFINPSGQPCKIQDEILRQLHNDKKAGFNLVHIVAMNHEHQKAFYDYGIRSLPSVVILDSKGAIAKHLAPGIQPYDILAQELENTK